MSNNPPPLKYSLYLLLVGEKQNFISQKNKKMDIHRKNTKYNNINNTQKQANKYFIKIVNSLYNENHKEWIMHYYYAARYHHY